MSTVIAYLPTFRGLNDSRNDITSSSNQPMLLGPRLTLEGNLPSFSNLLMVVFERPVTSLTSLNRIILNAIINTCNLYQCFIYISGALASPGLIG
jgi:hypothetical protein